MSIRKARLGKDFANTWESDTDYLLSDAIEVALLSRGCRLTDLRIVAKDYGALLCIRVGKSAEGALIGFYGDKTVFGAARRALEDIEGDMAKFRTDDWAMSRFDD